MGGEEMHGYTVERELLSRQQAIPSRLDDQPVSTAPPRTRVLGNAALARRLDSGQPLAPEVLSRMENGFGERFGDVRVHVDGAAASFGADAVTIGDHVSFRPGRYLPGTRSGDLLIAHELAHVVQQRRGGPAPPLDAAAPHERAARRSAESFAAGRFAGPDGPGTGLGFACGNGSGAGAGLPALTPDELLRFMLSQRGFHTAQAGPVSIDPKLVGRPTGYGYRTHAAIQLVDPHGNQVAVGVGEYTGRGGQHGERQAIGELRSLLSPGGKAAGGKMVVVVEQVPCDVCGAELRAIASEFGVDVLEIYVPARESLAVPGRTVTPKTASTTAFQGGRPVTRAVLLHGSSLAPGAPPRGPVPLPEPAPAVPGRRGAGRTGGGTVGGVLGVAIPLALGWLHGSAVAARIRERAGREGYVPRGAPSGEGLLYDLGAWLLDPVNAADEAVGMDARFNVAAWRRHIRTGADAKRPGDTLRMRWDIGRCAFDRLGHQEVEERTVVYRKQADGRWVVESGDARGTPDLDDIVSPDVPDTVLKALVMQNPCQA